MVMGVPVRVLKNELSEYLRRVRGGEALVVTDRGRPIAKIVPLSEGEDLDAAERLQRLVDAGDVTAPRGSGLTDIEPTRVRGARLSDTLVDDRR